MKRKSLIVLAGGFGTRLKTELGNTPKPLASISGTPFLHFLLNNWISEGINHFIFSLHYEANQIVSFVEQYKRNLLSKIEVDYVIESMPLGTGGAIVNVINSLNIEGSFFVANADTWLENGVERLTGRSPLAIALIKIDDVSRYGEVLLDKEGNIKGFKEKNCLNKAGYINAGLYQLSSIVFKGFGHSVFSLEADFIPQLIRKEQVEGIIMNSPFIDIGIPEDYKRFSKWIDSNKQQIL